MYKIGVEKNDLINYQKTYIEQLLMQQEDINGQILKKNDI